MRWREMSDAEVEGALTAIPGYRAVDRSRVPDHRTRPPGRPPDRGSRASTSCPAHVRVRPPSRRKTSSLSWQNAGDPIAAWPSATSSRPNTNRRAPPRAPQPESRPVQTWPRFPVDGRWPATRDYLHLTSQMLGKLRLALSIASAGMVSCVPRPHAARAHDGAPPHPDRRGRSVVGPGRRRRRGIGLGRTDRDGEPGPRAAGR